MKIGGRLLAVHDRARGTRVAASMTVLLSVIAIGFLPRCELSPIAKLAKHSRASAVSPVGVSHNHGFSACISGNLKYYCSYGAHAGPALTNFAPAIVDNTSSSSDGDAHGVFLPLSIASAPRNVMTSAYSLSAPSFRLYLRFLHLLI